MLPIEIYNQTRNEKNWERKKKIISWRIFEPFISLHFVPWNLRAYVYLKTKTILVFSHTAQKQRLNKSFRSLLNLACLTPSCIALVYPVFAVWPLWNVNFWNHFHFWVLWRLALWRFEKWQVERERGLSFRETIANKVGWNHQPLPHYRHI